MVTSVEQRKKPRFGPCTRKVQKGRHLSAPINSDFWFMMNKKLSATVRDPLTIETKDVNAADLDTLGPTVVTLLCIRF